MRTAIKKWGNSQGLRFSKETLAAIGVQVDDEVNVIVKGHQIIIEKASTDKISLKEVFEGYRKTEHQTEIDWGEHQGEEVW